jgi:taurine dioxygenase
MAPGRLSAGFGVRPIDAVLGAEVLGVDLAQPLHDDLFAALYDAFLRHHLLVFRAQRFSDDQHVAFARRWGKLQRHVLNQYRHEGNPDILVLTNLDASGKPKGEHPDPGSAIWHTDGSWARERGLSTMLYAVAVPKAGGDTLFASMYAAYDALSEPMKRLLEDFTAMHEGEHVYRGRYGAKEDDQRQYPKAEHPVIRTHPVSGRKALYVNGGFTTRIVQLKRAESDALLHFLYRHVETPEFHCRFRWQVNSVAFWDNRCVQHHAMWDYYPQRRHGHRVTIKGDKPFYRA